MVQEVKKDILLTNINKGTIIDRRLFRESIVNFKCLRKRLATRRISKKKRGKRLDKNTSMLAELKSNLSVNLRGPKTALNEKLYQTARNIQRLQ